MLTNLNFDRSIVQWLDDYAPQGIFTTDACFVIRGWNRWLTQNAGHSAEAVIGRYLFDVFPELSQRQLKRFYDEALNGKVTVLAQRFHKYLIKLPARPESRLDEMQQSAHIAPLVSDGQVVGTITAIEDVSARIVRESELIAAREEADKANQAKDRFLAVLSHDLRTPLTAILGWTHVFRERPADPSIVRKGAEVIERSALVQLELIEQVLDISRIGASKVELKIEPVNLREITVNTLEALEPIGKSRNVRIECVVPDEERVAALDSKRFKQIIWNLVSNALKFTSTGGWVRVNLAYRQDSFHLTIADNGIGIDSENLPHLFEPMWQAEGSGRHGGLGLGLAIVKHWVELHGGSICAESLGPGHGAVFSVEIPWSFPEANQSSPRARSGSHVT